MWRNAKLAAMVLAVTMASGRLALAQSAYDYGDRDNYRYREEVRVARENGQVDGSEMGRKDFAHRKPYDPYPRGKYAHEDRGYHREFGDKYAYQEQYARGYEQGYAQAFGRY